MVMAESAPNEALINDKARLFIAALVIALSVVGFYYFAESSLLFRVLGIVVALIVAAGIFFTTGVGRETGGFLKAARVELNKVVWPTRKETTQMTLVIFVVVMLVALFLWAVDMLLSWFMRIVIY